MGAGGWEDCCINLAVKVVILKILAWGLSVLVTQVLRIVSCIA